MLGVTRFYERKKKKVLKFIRQLRTKTFFISYPKSGRTWVRLMVWKYICVKESLETGSLDLYEITRKSDHWETIDFDHEQANHRLKLLPSNLHFQQRKLKQKRIMFISRDPRDTAISMFFQLTKRETVDKTGYYMGSVSNFIRDERFGIEKIVSFNNLWINNREYMKDFLHISYEGLKKDTATELKKILLFLGEKEVDPKIIQEIVDYTSFTKMKQLEKNGQFDHFSMKPRNQSCNESYKVRKGIVGGYISYFTKSDIEFANRYIRNNLAKTLQKEIIL